MEQAAVFSFVRNVLGKLRIPVHIISEDPGNTDELPDFGLRRLAGREHEYEGFFDAQRRLVSERVIYRYSDEFLCNYNSFRIALDGKSFVVVIGPYLRLPLGEKHLMELAQELSVPPRLSSAFYDCYTNIPVISDEAFYYAILNSLGELMWSGSGAYELVELETSAGGSSAPVPDAEQERAATYVSMQLLEERYRWENELMRMIAEGQVNRAEKMLPVNSGGFIKKRIADPVRNMKNYAVICNTIMRKAAEQGGVHPFYLDRISTAFALRIEAQTSEEATSELIMAMIREYCRLVRKYSLKDYSPQVRRAVLFIDSELSSELSLKLIAEKLGMNPSYLSTVFKKETGMTVIDYINRRRMEHAASLLRSTGLQVQNIAQYCGINDPNYFTKLFKKYTGRTPGQYRASPTDRFTAHA